jgi:hypothetical protein
MLTGVDVSYYVEIRKEIIRTTTPLFVPLDQIDKVRGFRYRSVYAYDYEVMTSMLRNGETKGFQGCSVYSDCLFLDIDDKSYVDECRQILLNLRLWFTEWFSGRRGTHFHIPIKPMYGPYLIDSQKKFVTDTFDRHRVDRSIYSINGQIRLGGSRHEKSGKHKLQLQKFDGYRLEIPMLDKPLPTVYANTYDGNASKALYVKNLTYRRGEGQRHQHIMILTKDAIKLHIPLDIHLENMIAYNRRWMEPPLSDWELEKHVRKTWRQYEYLGDQNGDSGTDI